MKKIIAAISVFFTLGLFCLVAGGGLYTDGEPISVGTLTATLTMADTVTFGHAGTDGQISLYSEQGATDYAVTVNPNATMTSNADFYLPADEPAAQSLATVSTGGVMSWISDSAGLRGSLSDETGTGLSVFNNSPTLADDLTLGSTSADGSLIIYSDQGGSDYTATIEANTAMTSNAAFYLPADEPSGTSFLTMTTGGVIGFDASDYVAVTDTGTVKATALQAAAADLGAANVTVDLSNTNGSYTTGITIDGNLTASETRADPIIGGGNGAYAAIKGITETVTIAVGSGLDPVVETTGNLAPANALIFGATARVTTAPGGGATTLDIGVSGSGNLDTLVDGMSTSVDTTANTAANGDGTQLPITNAAAAKLTLTTDADVTVSDMIVKVTIYYLLFSAQTS